MFCHENTGTNPIRGPLSLHKAVIYSIYVNLKPVQLQLHGAYRTYPFIEIYSAPGG